MLKKTVTYKDLFTGEEVSETFYFHLSEAELLEMEVSVEGGLAATLKRIVAAEDVKALIAEFKDILLASYGKQEDRRFVKNDTVREEFKSSPAYSELFMELATDTEAAIEFINGVIPQGLPERAEKIAKSQANRERINQLEAELAAAPTGSPEPPKESHAGGTINEGGPSARAEFVATPKEVTKLEITQMSQQELAETAHKLATGEMILKE